AALDALDAVLARGASPLLPESVHATVPTLAPRTMPWRYASVDELLEALIPILDDIETRWRARAAREGLASTILRTSLDYSAEALTVQPLAEIVPLPPVVEAHIPPLAPGNVAFQPDGRGLACFGDRV